MINNEQLKVSKIVFTIDTNLAAYYEERGRNDYYSEINDIKIGKFAKYCADREYDSDAIENEFDCTTDNDDDIENCEIIAFDDNMPIHPQTPKNDIDKERFRVLKLMYKSSLNSTQSTPHRTPYPNIYSPLSTKQSFNSCFIENENENKNNCNDLLLHKTCAAIGEWYHVMRKKNYYDIKGKGLFSKWFVGEGMEINDMDDEFEEFENCGYLVFDIDKQTQINYFPLPNNYNNDENLNKEYLQFQIMSYCFKYGKAPNKNNLNKPPKAEHKFDIDPFDDSIDYLISDEWITKTEKIYAKLCPNLYSVIRNQEKNLMRLFAIGYKYNIPLVQLLTDTFMRDRLKSLNGKNMLTVCEWSLNNIYIQYLMRKYGKTLDISNIISSAITSYMKRIVPKFRMHSMCLQIKDNLYEIALHFKAATEFIQKILLDASKHHTKGGYRIANAPYQWDFCIAVGECEATETVITPAECEEIKFNEELLYKYCDILGDIPDKLQYNNCKFLQTEFNPNKYNDTKLMSFVRCYKDSYNTFLQKYNIKKDEFPRGLRFCTLIDRRKLITKRKRNIDNEYEYIEMNRNKNQTKLDDILFWIPPNTNNNKNNDNIYKHGIKEVYFEKMAQCLIPNYDYCAKKTLNNMNYCDDTQQSVKCKNLSQTITSSSKCNGGLLIFSFQIEANDEIACYLCWQGRFIRFMPNDILQILPRIFASSPKNKAFVQQSLKNKDKNIVNKIKYSHRKFDNWYHKIGNK